MVNVIRNNESASINVDMIFLIIYFSFFLFFKSYVLPKNTKISYYTGLCGEKSNLHYHICNEKKTASLLVL